MNYLEYLFGRIPDAPRNLQQMKEAFMHEGALHKQRIDSCPVGDVYRMPVNLPSYCWPNRADFCFCAFDEGYTMVLDRTVLYGGTNPRLHALCRYGILCFDSWYELLEFWEHMPCMD